eukprot:14152917-Alexandrium_andersonii.AAC.1
MCIRDSFGRPPAWAECLLLGGCSACSARSLFRSLPPSRFGGRSVFAFVRSFGSLAWSFF